MSLTDRSPARAEGDRSVGLGSHRPTEPRVAAPPRPLRCLRVLAATMGLRLRVTAATAPGWRPRSARWNRSRLEGPLARSEGDRSVGHCSPGQLEPLAAAPLRCRRDLAATLRSRGRPKMSQGPKGPFLLLGSSCHAASGARIVPWGPKFWEISQTLGISPKFGKFPKVGK